jgi:hypothetical protein
MYILINTLLGGGVDIYSFSGEKAWGQKKKNRREIDDAIGDAGKGHGSLHETLSLKPGRSCGRTGKTREKE